MFACLSCGAFLAAGSGADTVHLANGNRLDGIVVDDSADRVRLQLPFGEIELPSSAVDRIERSATPLAEFLQRKERLVVGHGSASDWVRLGHWAWQQGLRHNALEAARRAAAEDVETPGLRGLMSDLGMVFDRSVERWVEEEEYLQMRGFEWQEGRWIDVATKQRLEAEAERSSRLEMRMQQRERWTRAIEALAIAQLMEAEQRRSLSSQPVLLAHPVYAPTPTAFVPAGRTDVTPARSRHLELLRHVRSGSRYLPRNCRRGAGASSAYPSALLHRQTGSFLPVRPAKRHHGGFVKSAPPRP